MVGNIGLNVLNTAARSRAGGLETERRGVGLLAKPAVRERVGIKCLAVACGVVSACPGARRQDPS